MTRPAVDTECLEYAYGLQDSSGDVAAFRKILPTDISRLGGANELESPNVIDGTRQRHAGKVIRRNAGFDYNGPISMSSLGDFIYAAMYRNPTSVDRSLLVDVAVSAKTSSGYTLSFSDAWGMTGAQIATKVAPMLANNSILYINGHDDVSDDGYKFINGNAVVTGATIRVPTTLASGSATVANLRASIAGVLMTASTLTSWDVTGTDAVLTFSSAAGAQAFTDTHKLLKDQPVHFGHYINGAITDTMSVANGEFGYAIFDYRDGDELHFKEIAPSLQTDVANMTRNVTMMFADYITNSKGCGDADYYEHVMTIQEYIPAEGSGQNARPASYTYVEGCEVNTLSFEFPDGTLARMTVGMLGQRAYQSSTVKTNGDSVSTGSYPDVMNSSADFARIGIKDQAGSDRGTSVDTITFAINNNLSQRTRAGKLAAFKITKGQFQANVNATALFTHPEILDDIFNSKPTSVRLIQRCFDGAVYFYTPNVLQGNGARTRARQNVTTATLEGQANVTSKSQGEYTIGVGRFFGDFQTVEDF